jgi:hypothetical protein
LPSVVLVSSFLARHLRAGPLAARVHRRMSIALLLVFMLKCFRRASPSFFLTSDRAKKTIFGFQLGTVPTAGRPAPAKLKHCVSTATRMTPVGYLSARWIYLD